MSYFVFFKQKTAYELRISDWSSDVCSSDLPIAAARPVLPCTPSSRRKVQSRFAFRWRYPMALERTEVEKIAHLARLGLSEADLPRTTETLNNILGLIDRMQAVDTTGIARSEERRVGKECVSTGRFWGSPVQ